MFEPWLCVPDTLETTDSAGNNLTIHKAFAILEALLGMFSGSMQRGHQIFQNAKITHGLLYTNSTKTRIFKPPFPTDMECQVVFLGLIPK